LPEEKAKLENEFLMRHVADPGQAWRVVVAVLCAPENAANRSYLTKLVPQKVREPIESNGDEERFRIVPRNPELISDLMAKGQVWRVSFRGERDRIVVQYLANEACVKGFTLTYAQSRWSVFAVSEACD
jgi:hypothetical protein